MIAASAVLAVLFPNLGLIPELIITTVFMILYVVIGGAKGAGMVGILKLGLLYVAMIGSGILVLHLTGGVGGFTELVRTIDNPDGVNFFSLFARGIGKDLGAGVSLLLGVLTTQTYAQAVLWSKSDSAARTGALISTFLIPPIGIGGILVGLFMRATHPGIVAKTALTGFVTEYMPPVLSGIVLGTLFIAVVGTGAGLALCFAGPLRHNGGHTLVGMINNEFGPVAGMLSACSPWAPWGTRSWALRLCPWASGPPWSSRPSARRCSSREGWTVDSPWPPLWQGLWWCWQAIC